MSSSSSTPRTIPNTPNTNERSTNQHKQQNIQTPPPPINTHSSITPAQAFAYLLRPLVNDPLLAATATNLLSVLNADPASQAPLLQQASQAIAGLLLNAASGINASNNGLNAVNMASLPVLNSKQQEQGSNDQSNKSNYNSTSKKRHRKSLDKGAKPTLPDSDQPRSIDDVENEEYDQLEDDANDEDRADDDHQSINNANKDRIDITSTTAPRKKKKKLAELNFVCAVCRKGFERLYNLQSHQKTHLDEKPFDCPCCDAKFARNHDLTRHQKIHSTEKPYVCQDCGRGFTRLDALRRHERMDPDGKRMHCSLTPP